MSTDGRFYHSGTPRNDKYQFLEDSICEHRLFSLHGEYLKAVDKWAKALPRDRSVRPYPRTILLDSGAFTAWNAGTPTTVEDVTKSYDQIIKQVDGKFDEIWCINLDVIPGERGRTATKDEILRAFEVSDINFEILTKRFGARIMPVFHQDEEEHAPHRLRLVAEQAEYICLSPRNDLPEWERKDWSVMIHRDLHRMFPGKWTHGLATTGNNMIRDVPWFSVDSAAWVLHGGMAGKLDVFFTDTKGMPLYRGFFMSSMAAETDEINIAGRPEVYGKMSDDKIHYKTTNRENKAAVQAALTRVHKDWTVKLAENDSRVRSLVCLNELSTFFKAARTWQLSNKKSIESRLDFASVS